MTWAHRIALGSARVLLLLWAVGLGIAAWQLGSWRQELSSMLVQLNADRQFRARAQDREAVDPEWYRRKALTLLSANERMRRDTAWTLFVPGSWRLFDDLEEQLQARIASEFGDIVVETLRRELLARASRLTGVPQLRGTAELDPSARCEAPRVAVSRRQLSGAAEDLPEFAALAKYVQDMAALDEAVSAFLSLQNQGGQPEQLRKLVAYALQKDLRGPLAGSVRMFQGPDEVSLQPAVMLPRLQGAARCSLEKGTAALHARLLQTNDLFALEQGLAKRSAGLFDTASRPLPFDRTLERYRAVHALLQDQHALLAKGRNAWMRQGSLQLGPGYDALLQRVGAIRLLGPEVVQQVQAQSARAYAEFRLQFESAFGTGEPGIVWLEREGRFGLSPQRTALRAGLGNLLQQPFMGEVGAARVSKLSTAGSLAAVTTEAQELAQMRERYMQDGLPTFPPFAQPAVRRVVNARVAELVYQQAYRSVKSALPPPDAPVEPASFRTLREHVAVLQELLKEAQAPAWGERLAALLDAELARRLGAIHAEWRRQPMFETRAADFAWWQGESLPLAHALGATEAVSLSRTAARLEVLGQQGKMLLALGSPALASDPSVQNWSALQSELERYQGRQPDSSLLRLERYLVTLGPDFRRDNCAERLAAYAPQADHGDEIARLHAQLHAALSQRCVELRPL
jgi:type VI secretion system protein ImpL